MRIAGTNSCSLVNGEGVRYVIFLQGCQHFCPGCHNPDTWDFEGGEEVSVEKLVADISFRKYIDGITLSGGDPFYQQEECLKLIDHMPGMNVWIYTGFEYDEIKDTELAKRADVLVTGPFIEDLRCEGKMYGSSNQEIHRRSEL
jgi:anaerobic ribonucleoside-triphosphate reductase activating protein